MAQKTSVRGAARDAVRQDRKARQGEPLAHAVKSMDSFINFSQKLGVGADNALSSGTYGFNPITRNRVLLEWIHRGSWLGGVAVDIIPDDMTRKGIEFGNEMSPDDAQKIETAINKLGFWQRVADVAKWGRLYGGAIGVMLIDGQDFRTPLNIETVGPGQFKGILPLDRWQVEPTLEDLVTDLGPHLGLPKYYRVQANAAALRGQAIHYSRVAFRIEGVRLPYQQRLTENLWGISVLERLYDRMISFDSATTGAAQLVFKAYLRTLKIKGMREIVAAGGAPMQGLLAYTELMRRFQGQEGITLLDGEDEFEIQQTSAFSSVGDILLQLGQQLSGALQIPLVRMFGQSPAGLNSTGESDLTTYYDGIMLAQERDLSEGVATSYRLAAQSEGIKLPDDFEVQFRSLRDLTEVEKAEVAEKTAKAVVTVMDGGLIGQKTGLQELRQSSRRTGIFTNITQEHINAATDDVLPPMAETELGQQHEAGMMDKEHEHEANMAELGHGHATELADKGAQTALQLAKAKEKSNAGPDGKKKPVASGARRRAGV